MGIKNAMYSTSQKKVNVSTVRYALGALLVRSRFALGTLLVRLSSACGAVRCGAVWFGAVRCGWCGTVRLLSAMCACAIMCALRFRARG